MLHTIKYGLVPNFLRCVNQIQDELKYLMKYKNVPLLIFDMFSMIWYEYNIGLRDLEIIAFCFISISANLFEDRGCNIQCMHTESQKKKNSKHYSCGGCYSFPDVDLSEVQCYTSVVIATAQSLNYYELYNS